MKQLYLFIQSHLRDHQVGALIRRKIPVHPGSCDLRLLRRPQLCLHGNTCRNEDKQRKDGCPFRPDSETHHTLLYIGGRLQSRRPQKAAACNRLLEKTPLYTGTRMKTRGNAGTEIRGSLRGFRTGPESAHLRRAGALQVLIVRDPYSRLLDAAKMFLTILMN
jgi:hypothetical protein